MTLIRSGSPVRTLFDLVGHYENDMTSALAYALAQCPALLRSFTKAVCSIVFEENERTFIHTQTARRGKGITDIEVSIGDDFFCVIEAKKGPFLPDTTQLTCYSPIVAQSTSAHRYIVTISHSTVEMSKVHFPTSNIAGIPLVHLPWHSIKQLVDQSVAFESNKNKWILTQFSNYLKALLGMENRYSNMVYVVALGDCNPEGWKLSWIDIVEKRDRYFYPVGGGWPDPPNYLGFRYNGKLQSIRWVKSHTLFTNPRTIFPEAPKVEWQPNYCLTLDSPIVPSHEIRAGKRINFAARCWCAIDALLTSSTVSEALTKTELRKEK